MAGIIDYVDTCFDYDALVKRTGRVTLLKQLVEAEEEMLQLGIHMRKLNRDLNHDLEKAGIEPATREAYYSGPYMKYRVSRSTIEARTKALVNGVIPNLQAQLEALK